MENPTQPIELIGHPICPYVQRTRITLLEKKLEFKETFIDLNDKPGWFLEISPLGKVPLLRIGAHVLFESMVINEYLDATHPPAMQPKDPLTCASQRAWIEFSSGLIMFASQLVSAATEEEFEAKKLEGSHKLSLIEQILMETPFFNGKDFCLIDVAYAPAFVRLHEIDKIYPLKLFNNRPKVKVWAENLVNQQSVKKSLIHDFKEQYRNYIKNRKGFLSSHL